jgi:DNA-binding NtrC family response regulator
MSRLLVIDDEESIRLAMVAALSAKYQVDDAGRGEEAAERLRHESYDLVLTDLRMGKMGGLEVLREAKARNPSCAVMIVTAFASLAGTAEAMKLGADDYLAKPFSLIELEHRVAAVLERSRLTEERDSLRQEGAASSNFLGQSDVFRELKGWMFQAAASSQSVLIFGERGSGKESLARAIHASSSRKNRPFVKLNCQVEHLEAELFGQERGAYTDAKVLRKGVLERADLGTLFLEAPEALSPELQGKLQQALEQRSFERLGGTASLKSDFRLITATELDLKAKVAEGQFRGDLYAMLAAFSVVMPPLRERGTDALLLTEHFLKGRKLRLSPEGEALLRAYDWPGNIRELQCVVERAAFLSQAEILRLDLVLSAQESSGSGMRVGKNLAELMDEAEKRLVEEALHRAGHNQSQAAKWLGIERSTLQYKLKKFKLA